MHNKLREKICWQEAEFLAGAKKCENIPTIQLPQIAFLGKSNVGKSSLINTICRRKNLVKVSRTPGTTRQINFFLVKKKLVIADFPGYGFAKVTLKEKQAWKKLILYYLKNSPNLKLVNLLIDARRGIQEKDLKTIQLLSSYQKKTQILFTKVDKIKLKDRFEVEKKNYLSLLGYKLYDVIFSSSKNGLGMKHLKYNLMQHIK